MTAAELERRLLKINITDIAGDSLDRHKDEVRQLNIAQLMAGINAEGKPLSPKYSEDPYFKSRESALRYARWKQKLFPDTPFDTPNLIITGVFHAGITVSRAGEQLRFEGKASFSGSVAAKYGGTELGLSPDSKQKAYREIVKPELVAAMREKINGR